MLKPFELWGGVPKLDPSFVYILTECPTESHHMICGVGTLQQCLDWMKESAHRERLHSIDRTMFEISAWRIGDHRDPITQELPGDGLQMTDNLVAIFNLNGADLTPKSIRRKRVL